MASKVDTRDPNVRRLAYNMYRGILNNYNDKANTIISTLPKERVREDQGVSKQLESMIRQSSQISGGGQNGAPGNGFEGGYAPPPPPPLAPAGNIPAVRLPSEIGPARKEPPAAIQNAMMTKDKKPFTYTPGGLDLNEIRSPRMARRINRNAHTEDSCTAPQNRPPPPMAHQPLPPSALAAMQPQIAIPVFPPGGMSPQPHSPSPNVYSPPPPPPQPSTANVPPPPPPPPSSGAPPPPPPPPMPSQGSAPLPPPLPAPAENGTSPKPGYRPPPDYLSEIPNHPPLRPVSQMRPNPADFINDIPNHAPLKPVNAPPRSSYEPAPSQPIQVQLKPVSPKPSTASQPSESQPSPIFNNTLRKTSPEPQPQPQQITNNITRPQEPPYTRQPSTPQSAPSSGTPEFNSQMNFPKPAAPSPGTLSKAPAPWMSTRPVQKETPPWAAREERSMSREDDGRSASQPSTPQIQQQPTYTPPSPAPPFNYQNSYPTPYSPQPQVYAQQPHPQAYTQQSQPQTYAQQPQQFNQPAGQPVTRVIPIQIEGREPPAPMRPPPFQPPMQMPIPPPIQMHPAYQAPMAPPTSSPTPQGQQQVRTRIIPIQMEGDKTSPPRQQAPTPTQMRGSPRYVPSSPTPATPAESANGDTPDGRPKLQSQFSWSQGNPAPIQSRSFRVLQKITGSDEDQTAGPAAQQPPAPTFLVNRVFPPQASETEGADVGSNGWDPNMPPYYPNPNYWYYPPQSVEEQQQFWEHYNAMCAYMAQMNAAAYRYSPYPMYQPSYPPPYPSDSEEYSGYSSSDEMNYYGQMFKQQARLAQCYSPYPYPPYYGPPLPPQHPTTPSNIPSDSAEHEISDDASDTDTEKGEGGSPLGLQSIKSVTDINVYKSATGNSDEAESSEEEEEDEESVIESEVSPQLSVIYEESEHSTYSEIDSIKKDIQNLDTDDESSTSTLDNNQNEVDEEEEDDDDDTENSMVKVRLPLQLKFSRSENNEEVTTVIVGNSEVESTPDDDDQSLIITEIRKDDSDPDVSVTVHLRRSGSSIQSKVEDPDETRCNSPIDFWNEIGKDDDVPKSKVLSNKEEIKTDENEAHWEDDSSGTSVLTVKKADSESSSSSESEIDDEPAVCTVEKCDSEINTHPPEENDVGCNEDPDSASEYEDDDNDSDDSSCSRSSSSSSSSSSYHDISEKMSSQSINKKASLGSGQTLNREFDLPASVNGSYKSQEESEEDDSGVTSDMSRHISETDTDPECGSELRKMSRYQRAATHSRLFKLLQEECSQEDEEEEESLSSKKERLSLPLKPHCPSEPDSLSSSSGVNSPSSPTVTDRLVKELVQSLLSKKKGRHFRKLPMEKLHAAALRILQEDMDPYDTGSTSDESNFFLSPVKNRYTSTIETQPVINEIPDKEMYGGNYYDYCDYYNTWGNANAYYDEPYDIMPSKTFRVLQENTNSNGFNSEPIKGLIVKCPRVGSTTSNHASSCTSTPIPFEPDKRSSPQPAET